MVKRRCLWLMALDLRHTGECDQVAIETPALRWGRWSSGRFITVHTLPAGLHLICALLDLSLSLKDSGEAASPDLNSYGI